MLVLDSITLNYDRHYGNFGFMYDTDTFKVTRMAPIYDNDCSLLALTMISDKTFDEVYNLELNNKRPRIGGEHFNIIAKRFMTKKLYSNIKKFNGKVSLPKLKGISDKRHSFIEKLVNKRLNDIVNIIEGTD